MSQTVETVNPGVQGVRTAVELYKKRYPEFADALAMYGAIMEVQQEALEDASCSISMSAGEVEARFLRLRPLLDPEQPEVDAEQYGKVVDGICRVIERLAPRGFSHRDQLEGWEGLSAANLPRTRVALLERERLVFPGDWGDDALLAPKILWESLVPLYRTCGSIPQNVIEQSLWQRGVCPVCGQPPFMGEFRRGDGLWLLECSLCHTLWSVQRASCPFCSRGSSGLEYLYVGDDSKRRVQYCSECGRYVKTVDMREDDSEVLLPLEDIVTVRLDRAAEEEGLKPAGVTGITREG